MPFAQRALRKAPTGISGLDEVTGGGFGAKRVVLDTIETLFGAFADAAILRAELRRLFVWLKKKGVTAVITGERGDGTLTRHGIEEYVSDCVIVLDHRVLRTDVDAASRGAGRIRRSCARVHRHGGTQDCYARRCRTCVRWVAESRGDSAHLRRVRTCLATNVRLLVSAVFGTRSSGHARDPIRDFRIAGDLMSVSDPRDDASRPIGRPLRRSAVALAGSLLIVPLVALAIVPVYARSNPHLWGFPFFYWYQFVWVFVTAAFTYGAYLVIQRARRNSGGK